MTPINKQTINIFASIYCLRKYFENFLGHHLLKYYFSIHRIDLSFDFDLFLSQEDFDFLGLDTEQCQQLNLADQEVDTTDLPPSSDESSVQPIVYVSIRTPTTMDNYVSDQLPSMKLVFPPVHRNFLLTKDFEQKVFSEIARKQQHIHLCKSLQLAEVNYALKDVRFGYMRSARQRFTLIHSVKHFNDDMPFIHVKKNSISVVTYSVSYILDIFPRYPEPSIETLVGLRNEANKLDQSTQTDELPSTNDTAYSPVSSPEPMDIDPESLDKSPYQHCGEHRKWIQTLAYLNKRPQTFRTMVQHVHLARQIGMYMNKHHKSHPVGKENCPLEMTQKAPVKMTSLLEIVQPTQSLDLRTKITDKSQPSFQSAHGRQQQQQRLWPSRPGPSQQQQQQFSIRDLPMKKFVRKFHRR